MHIRQAVSLTSYRLEILRPIALYNAVSSSTGAQEEPTIEKGICA